MKRTANLGGVRVGPGYPVRVMSAINVSPESFYRGSVVRSEKELVGRVRQDVARGAEIIDVGAMSTAPYLESEVTEKEELERIRWVLRAVSGVRVVISVDTVRASVARFAIENGATVINDVSGLKNDPQMATVVRDHGASLVAMARSDERRGDRPIARVRAALRDTLRIAERAGIDSGRVVLDPGIGFFRKEGGGRAYSPQGLMAWYEWDAEVLGGLNKLESLGRPLCVGLSRKSFLGKILDIEDPEDRLTGSVAATALAVANGADLIRTHDVAETVQAVRVAEAVTGRARARPRIS